jgi:hypothetical protein
MTEKEMAEKVQDMNSKTMQNLTTVLIDFENALYDTKIMPKTYTDQDLSNAILIFAHVLANRMDNHMQDNEVSKKVQVEALGEQLHQMIKYFT